MSRYRAQRLRAVVGPDPVGIPPKLPEPMYHQGFATEAGIMLETSAMQFSKSLSEVEV